MWNSKRLWSNFHRKILSIFFFSFVCDHQLLLTEKFPDQFCSHLVEVLSRLCSPNLSWNVTWNNIPGFTNVYIWDTYSLFLRGNALQKVESWLDRQHLFNHFISTIISFPNESGHLLEIAFKIFSCFISLIMHSFHYTAPVLRVSPSPWLSICKKQKSGRNPYAFK